MQRGDLIYDRAKNNIKVLKERPEKLKIKVKKIIKDFSKITKSEIVSLSTLEKNSISRIKAKLISYVS